MKTAIVLVVLLVGCDDMKTMSNKQIIDETKYCESNGMKAETRRNGFTYEIVGVQCVPK